MPYPTACVSFYSNFFKLQFCDRGEFIRVEYRICHYGWLSCYGRPFTRNWKCQRDTSLNQRTIHTWIQLFGRRLRCSCLQDSTQHSRHVSTQTNHQQWARNCERLDSQTLAHYVAQMLAAAPCPCLWVDVVCCVPQQVCKWLKRCRLAQRPRSDKRLRSAHNDMI